MANLNNIREAIHKHTMVVGVGALILVLLMGWWVAINLGIIHTHPQPARAYFIDEETGEVSIHPASEIPPLLGKSGKPTVVTAVYYTCGSCAARKPAYYRKFTPEAKDALEKAHKAGSGAASPTAPGPSSNGSGIPRSVMLGVGQGELVRAPEAGSPWVPLHSEAGRKLVQELRSKCSDPNTYELCVP
ncbi:MAG: hypothetical protein WCI73_20685 [Phycisphaerae bacterium]